jgi:hypothetical protein
VARKRIVLDIIIVQSLRGVGSASGHVVADIHIRIKEASARRIIHEVVGEESRAAVHKHRARLHRGGVPAEQRVLNEAAAAFGVTSLGSGVWGLELRL